MSTRTILVVFLALLSGAGMAVGVLQSNRPKSAQTVDVSQLEPVLIAISNLERGQMVTEADVEVREWPKGFAPPDTLRTLEASKGRAAAGRILAGELVREVKLAKPGAGFGLAPVIPVGMRAITIVASRVNTNVGGFVLPGSKVDVLFNLRASGRGDETGGGSTTTLMQAVEVMAVDEMQEAPDTNQFDPKKLTCVTLQVTPDQANVLDLAQNMGTLSFALRNSSDMADADVAPATLTDIRRLAMPPNETPMFLDGDVAPPPGMKVVVSPPLVEKPESTWIVTLRGTQRGRVLLTGTETNR
ncbi:MAG: Flp pilus assembly protein CpaB [Pirellulaceae bacterium]|nr:Flp pilus assembly protein CpaB [Pirellulaceae bacterium]